jgi:hypothetical protein
VNIQPAPNNGYGQNGLFFINNIVELETLYWSTFRFGIGLWNYETNYAPWTRIFITGNSIHFLSDVHPQIDSDWFSIAVFDQAIATNFTGVQVLDNNVDSALYGTFPPVGVWLANNTDLNGVPISANGFTNSLDTRFFQNSQSVALALPQSPLNAGLVLNFSMIEGAGTNVHNYAQSYAIPDATYTQAGSVIGQINWTNSAVGFGIVTSNSAPTTDDLSTLTNYIGFTMPTNFGGSKSFTVSTVLRHPYSGANQPILFFGCLPGVGTP